MPNNISKDVIEVIKKEIADIAFDFCDACLGNPVSAAKSFYNIIKTMVSVRDVIFWGKVKRYLRGMDLSNSDKERLKALLSGQNNGEKNVKRLIQCIDNIESEDTIDFLAKATRALINGDIKDKATYFRICYVLEHTLYEDLCFLREHIKKEKLAYSFNTQGLLATGLMYISAIDNDGDGNDGSQLYSFTPVAGEVLKHAILYDEEQSNWRKVGGKIEVPHTAMPYEIATEEEINSLFDDFKVDKNE